MSRNPSAPPQTDDAYDEEYIISNILPHCKFISKHGGLSNNANQSESETDDNERNANNKSRSQDARKQTAIDCPGNTTFTSNSKVTNSINFTMDARTIGNLAAVHSSAKTTEVIQRWKEIVEPGLYSMRGGKWKLHEPKFLRYERRVIEERLQQIIRGREQGDLRQKIGPQHNRGFQPQTGRSEQWTVDHIWEVDRPTPAQQQDVPGTSSASSGLDQYTPMPMEEGEVDSKTDQDPSILEVSAVNWARYVGVKSVQYVKMGHAPKACPIAAQEDKNWDLEQVVRASENSSTGPVITDD